jgi:uncharacterized protein
MKFPLTRPWLLAAWPGMGGVAKIAGRYLAEQLQAEVVAEISPDDYFDLQGVQVRAGLVQDSALPRSRLLAWDNPGEGPDLLILDADTQPSHRGLGFCEDLLTIAQDQGIERVITFAAMATQSVPSAPCHVLAVASDQGLLGEIQTAGLTILEEGQILGLNGVLLAAAAMRGLPAACLLGEFPYYASSIPNPKASAAILRAFEKLTGIAVDLAALDQQAADIEAQLEPQIQRLQQLQKSLPAPEPEVEKEEVWSIDSSFFEDDALDAGTLARIEELFAKAASDRKVALELKALLDRHSVFKRYEDRFLDLFKSAE